jgi:hypothetical protein
MIVAIEDDFLAALENLRRQPGPADVALTGRDSDGLVIMTVVGDAVSVEISRALVPEARQRPEVTDAVAAAATNLVALYRASQSALGSAMGTAVGQHAAALMQEPQATFDARVDQLKTRIRATTERAARLRDDR